MSAFSLLTFQKRVKNGVKFGSGGANTYIYKAVRLLPLPPQSDAASVNLLPVHY